MNAEKEKRAIQYLRSFAPEDGYYLAYSGGKDSDVIRILADLAGVKHEIHHNHTTVDAPETVRYVRSIPGVIVDMPKRSMWRLIVDMGTPPMRISRYCCAELKEIGGKGRIVVTGVRRSESVRRNANGGLVKIIDKKKDVEKEAYKEGVDFLKTPLGGVVMNDDNDETRRFVERCYRTRKTMVNPIVDWDESDVWDFLSSYGCKSNPLYQCGWRRIGCIGCPMARKERYRHFLNYPKYKENYIRAFDRMIAARLEKGKKTTIWSDGEECFKWWMGEDSNQISIFDEIEMEKL